MAILFQDQFEVKEASKKFDKVTRLSCRLKEEGYDKCLVCSRQIVAWSVERPRSK